MILQSIKKDDTWFWYHIRTCVHNFDNMTKCMKGKKKKKRQRKNGENQHGSFLEAYIHNRKSFFLESQFGNHIFTIKLYILD